jgi:outer membrane protein OmpA-like peptidoglycan-associated protein
MNLPTKLALAFLIAGAAFSNSPSSAQTIGYAEAVNQFAIACKADIAKHCKAVPLGGGRLSQCLHQNSAVSAGCLSTIASLQAMVAKRATARASIQRICDTDIRRLCEGMQAGDGNLMECFFKTRRNASPQCQQAVSDAGYDLRLVPDQPTTQIALDPVDPLSANLPAGYWSANNLRQMALNGMHDPARNQRVNRPPLVDRLNNMAQITIAIAFDLNSARISPESFKAVGLMADALNSPYLQNYRFIIVGNTDARGKREYNLKLSQERADAIREALINPFGINPARLQAVGLGEEQLLDPAHPEAAENRRVQLINIGR